MSKHILEAKDVTFLYPDGTKALSHVDMQIERGKKVALIGANGAGKSTLFLHFNGLNKPESGEICFDGIKLNYSNNELMKHRKEIGIVFQEPDHQLFSASVLQEISFGPMNLKLNKAQILEKVEAAMEATGISLLKQKPTHFLSYGQKKRVAIASILAMEPNVLILDEPTSGLDPKNSDLVLDILNKLNKAGKTILISTHDIDMAYTWADYVYVMDQGKVIGKGAPEEVFFDKELLTKAGMKQPWIAEVYSSIASRCDSKTAVPKSKDELLNLISAL